MIPIKATCTLRTQTDTSLDDLRTFSKYTPAKPLEIQARRMQIKPSVGLLVSLDGKFISDGSSVEVCSRSDPRCFASWTMETPQISNSKASHCLRARCRPRRKTEKSAVVKILSFGGDRGERNRFRDGMDEANK